MRCCWPKRGPGHRGALWSVTIPPRVCPSCLGEPGAAASPLPERSPRAQSPHRASSLNQGQWIATHVKDLNTTLTKSCPGRLLRTGRGERGGAGGDVAAGRAARMARSSNGPRRALLARVPTARFRRESWRAGSIASTSRNNAAARRDRRTSTAGRRGRCGGRDHRERGGNTQSRRNRPPPAGGPGARARYTSGPGVSVVRNPIDVARRTRRARPRPYRRALKDPEVIMQLGQLGPSTSARRSARSASSYGRRPLPPKPPPRASESIVGARARGQPTRRPLRVPSGRRKAAGGPAESGIPRLGGTRARNAFSAVIRSPERRPRSPPRSDARRPILLGVGERRRLGGGNCAPLTYPSARRRSAPAGRTRAGRRPLRTAQAASAADNRAASSGREAGKVVRSPGSCADRYSSGRGASMYFSPRADGMERRPTEGARVDGLA